MSKIYRFAALGGDVRATATEWDAAAPIIIRDSAAPLVNARLKQAGAHDIIPDAVKDSLEREFKISLAAQIVYQKTFKHIVDVCGRDGIFVSPLKGLYLAEYTYPCAGARPMADLDIFVTAEHFDRALELLKGEGFSSELDFLSRRGHRQPSGAMVRDTACVNVAVDVHYRLLNEAGIRGLLIPRGRAECLDSDAVASMESRPYMDFNARVLSPPYLLLSLMLHHFTHGFTGMLWFLDTVLFARSMDADDWRTFASCMEKYSLTGLAAVYFNLTAKNLGCEMNDFLSVDVIDLIADETGVEPLMRAALRAGRLKPLHALMLLPGPAQKFAALMKFLFPSRFYLETINRRPLGIGSYLVELVKFQAKVLRG